MKILYIYPHFANKAGTERVLIDKMNWLSAHGYKVFALSYEQGGHPFSYPISSSVERVDLGVRFFPLYKMSLVKRFLFVMWKRRLLYKRLNFFLKCNHPDVVICTTYTLEIIRDLAKTCPFLEIPFVVESHVLCDSVSKSFKYRNRPFLFPLVSLYDKWMLRYLSYQFAIIILCYRDYL